MLYDTYEARESALKEIRKCINKINSIPTDILSYSEGTIVNHYLIQHMNLIKKEMEED